MEVTCHPRLGGASQREAGVTGIKPADFIYIQTCVLPVVSPERRGKKTILVDKVGIIRIVSPCIAYSNRVQNLFAAYNDSVTLDYGISPYELLVLPCYCKMLQDFTIPYGKTLASFCE